MDNLFSTPLTRKRKKLDTIDYDYEKALWETLETITLTIQSRVWNVLNCIKENNNITLQLNKTLELNFDFNYWTFEKNHWKCLIDFSSSYDTVSTFMWRYDVLGFEEIVKKIIEKVGEYKTWIEIR
ncbi:MAG: hypothetical protein ACD_4C00144G0009 [uncultured bacterium (gcode 4)]|uniref:Uncharacterized protein n=1 Tax=uncultured bacterium (gcode 4) TaxID=1234023 RepID=K2FV07_9BACT|nr:MAG: hypothetical protein ACD_4C00144G0009 [uncultured bacterium (gcode 4)]